MNQEIVLETTDAVSVIRINRPAKKNALTSAMYDRMAGALDAGEKDAGVRAHVFLGSEGVFTAGNDIKDFMAVATGGEHAGNAVEFLKRLVTLKKPVVAGVDGLAIGIGTTMLFHCDLVYATSASVFKTPFLDLGLVPEAASSLIAPRVMGPQRAFEMLCLGEGFSTERMVVAGLVNATIAREALERHVLEAAQRLAQKPPEALASARALLRGDENEVLARIDEESRLFAARLKSGEARMAFETFLAR